MATLDELRQDAITKIQQAFSRNRRLKNVAHRPGFGGEKKELNEYFGNDTWDKFVDREHLVYRMSDPDYIWVMTDQAYFYYLPAFLISLLHSSRGLDTISLALSKIVELLPEFSGQQLEALSACFEFLYRIGETRT